MTDNPVYQALADYQREQTAGWDMTGLVGELHRWKEIFAVEFKLELPPVAFCVKSTRSNCYGYFRPGHNEFGLTREIAINKDYLRHREDWQVFGTLFHELLHAWQDACGRPGKRNYHNAELRAKAAGYGLVIDRRGFTQYTPDSHFMELLRTHGVMVPLVPSLPVVTAGQSKLKKWSCGCTNVRVAVADFRARCLKCHNLFVRPD